MSDIPRKDQMEIVQGTIKEGDKIIIDNIDIVVSFNVTESFPKEKSLRGRFKIPTHNLIIPGAYEFVLNDGRSYKILITGLKPGLTGMTLVHFIEKS